MKETPCPECGARIPEGMQCRDYCNELIKWDFEDFLGAGQVHHLTVICYNLQHPSVYSMRGLEDAKEFLREFVEQDVSYEEHDRRNRDRLSSAVRHWKITGTPDDHASYAVQPHWETTARDIVEGGLEDYVQHVKGWSRSTYTTLKESGNYNT